MRRLLIVLLLPAVACATGGAPDTDTTDGPGEATTTTVAETTPTTEGTTTTGGDEAALPEGWTRCENLVEGYSIGYPSDWYTDSLGPETECVWFDPQPFQLEEDTEGPVAALNARAEAVSFDDVGATIPSEARLVTEEETTVAGHAAIRLEYVYEEEGPLLPEGTRVYEYRIDREGELFLVMTTALPETDDETYQDHKDVVDQAVETLRFSS